jgi:hypothetical protein
MHTAVSYRLINVVRQPFQAHAQGMEDRHQKRRRLYAGSHVPARVLAQLLRRLRQESDIDSALNVSEWQLNQSVNSLWDELGQPETLQHKDGEIQWHCASLKKTLQHAVAKSPRFRQAVHAAWLRGEGALPDRPMRLIIYGDEATPGMVLRLDNRRKLLGIYWSLREFGAELLKHGYMWLHVAVLRASLTKEVEGGVSHCVRLILRRIFITNKVSVGWEYCCS